MRPRDITTLPMIVDDLQKQRTGNGPTILKTDTFISAFYCNVERERGYTFLNKAYFIVIIYGLCMLLKFFHTSIVKRSINRAHTKILSRAPRGLHNAIEGRSKDLATRGAARGLVSLSASRPTLAR